MASKPAYVHPGFPPKNPPPVPPNNVYRIRVHGSIEDQATYNTFYYADDGFLSTPVRADLFELMGLFQASAGVLPAILDMCSNTWTCVRLLCDVPTSPTVAEAELLIDLPGVSVAPHLPTQVAITLAKRTTFKGRQGRGRISMPAVSTAVVTGSRLTSPGGYETLATKMKQHLIGSSKEWRPGLYGPKKLYAGDGLAILETEETWVDQADVLVRLTVGTARTRKLAVGI